MAWKDQTAKGGTFDKEAMLSNTPPSYDPEDYDPKLALKGAKNGVRVPFTINGIACGWCVFNKCFRPIEKNGNSWQWIPGADMDSIKVDGDKVAARTLMEIVKEYHRLRDIQNQERPKGVLPEEEGLLALIRFFGFRYAKPATVRVQISKLNTELIKLYNEMKSKESGKYTGDKPNGWFEEDNPLEFKTAEEQEEAKYSSKLMKGLYLSSDYRKPTKKKKQTSKYTPEQKTEIFSFLSS